MNGNTFTGNDYDGINLRGDYTISRTLPVYQNFPYYLSNDKYKDEIKVSNNAHLTIPSGCVINNGEGYYSNIKVEGDGTL